MWWTSSECAENLWLGGCHIVRHRSGPVRRCLAMSADLTLLPPCLWQSGSPSIRIPVSDPEGIPSPERLALRAKTRVGVAAPTRSSPRERYRVPVVDMPEDVFPTPAVGKMSVSKEFGVSPGGQSRTGKDDASGFDDWKKRTDNLAAAVLAAARVWREPGSPPAKPLDTVAGPLQLQTGDADQGQEQPRQARQGAQAGLIPFHAHDDQPHGQVHGDDFDNPVSDKEEMHGGLSEWELSQSVAVDLTLLPQTVAASASADILLSADGAGLFFARVLVLLALFRERSPVARADIHCMGDIRSIPGKPTIDGRCRCSFPC